MPNKLLKIVSNGFFLLFMKFGDYRPKSENHLRISIDFALKPFAGLQVPQTMLFKQCKRDPGKFIIYLVGSGASFGTFNYIAF